MAKDNWFKGVILALLIAIGGWSLFQLAFYGVSTLFKKIGIIEPFWQYLSIVIFVVIALLIGWHTNLKGAIKKLVK